MKKKYENAYIMIGDERIEVEELEVHEDTDPVPFDSFRALLPIEKTLIIRNRFDYCRKRCPFKKYSVVFGCFISYCTLYNVYVDGLCLSNDWRDYHIREIKKWGAIP